MDFEKLYNPIATVPLKFTKRDCLKNKRNTYETDLGRCKSPNMYHVFLKLFNIQDKTNRAKMYLLWKNDLLWRCNADGDAVHAELTRLIGKHKLNAYSRQRPLTETTSLRVRLGDTDHLQMAIQELIEESKLYRAPV